MKLRRRVSGGVTTLARGSEDVPRNGICGFRAFDMVLECLKGLFIYYLSTSSKVWPQYDDGGSATGFEKNLARLNI